MAEHALREPLSLLLRKEWTRFGSRRHWQRALRPIRTTSPASTPPQATHTSGAVPWTPHHENVALRPNSNSRPSHNRDQPKSLPLSSYLTDTFARTHTYLRIAVTERCNLRCLYCMPEDGVPLSPPEHLLTTPEIVHLAQLFVSQGVNKIRLTGGEPTVRKDIVDLMRQIGALRRAGLKELCLTTNGLNLHRKIGDMVEAGLTGVNLSLDTLDPHQFTIMTRRNGHAAVMRSLERILEMNRMGASVKLKVNCVVMRGINEQEIIPFVELGREKDIEVRFIEYMPFDGNKWSQGKMLGYQEMLAMIRDKYPEVCKVQDHPNDTSKTYQIPGFVGRIGFITSMTHNFCGTCNRLRITSDGNLKVCLFGNAEVSLRDMLRKDSPENPMDLLNSAASNSGTNRHDHPIISVSELALSSKDRQLMEVIEAAVKRKKARHAGMGKLENMKNRPMILIDDIKPMTAPSPGSKQWPRPHDQPFHPLRANHILSQTLSNKLVVPSFVRFYHPTAKHWGPGRLIEPRPVYGQNSYRRSFGKRPPEGPPSHEVMVDSYQKVLEEQALGPTTSDEVVPEPYAKAQNNVPYLPAVSREDSHKHTSAKTPDNLPTRKALTHITGSGAVHMVDITGKAASTRTATARAIVVFGNPHTYSTLKEGSLKKGDVLAVARIAGIQATKKTAELIPLAHPGLSLTRAEVDLELIPPENPSLKWGSTWRPSGRFGRVQIRTLVSCEGKTGVEMEALTAASVSALTIYDMCKAVDRHMIITGACITGKEGGKSGDWSSRPPRFSNLMRNEAGTPPPDTGPAQISSASGTMPSAGTGRSDLNQDRANTSTPRLPSSITAASPIWATGRALYRPTEVPLLRRQSRMQDRHAQLERTAARIRAKQAACDAGLEGQVTSAHLEHGAATRQAEGQIEWLLEEKKRVVGEEIVRLSEEKRELADQLAKIKIKAEVGNGVPSAGELSLKGLDMAEMKLQCGWGVVAESGDSN